jgi:hypothetical protein
MLEKVRVRVKKTVAVLVRGEVDMREVAKGGSHMFTTHVCVSGEGVIVYAALTVASALLFVVPDVGCKLEWTILGAVSRRCGEGVPAIYMRVCPCRCPQKIENRFLGSQGHFEA